MVALLVVGELTAAQFGYVISATLSGKAIVGLLVIWVLGNTVDTSNHFSLVSIGLTVMAIPILVSPVVSLVLMLPVMVLGIENLWQVMYLGGALLVVVGSNLCGIHILKSAFSTAPASRIGTQQPRETLRRGGLDAPTISLAALGAWLLTSERGEAPRIGPFQLGP